MKLKEIIYPIFFTLLLLIPLTSFSQVTDAEIQRLSERIEEVEKVEQLYSIRYAVSKYATLSGLTLKQQSMLAKSMRDLSDEFKIRSHFKNAADVYKEYLDYNAGYLTRYNAFAKDSLIASQNKIASAETDSIVALDAEILSLNNRREAVSGLKAKYYTFGSIGSIALIVITIIIGLSKIRSIKQAGEHIASNQEKLHKFNPQSAEASMLIGSMEFSKSTAASNASIISGIIDTIKQSNESKQYQKEIQVLQQAKDEFSSVS